ncbi:MAG: hypothetical protein KAH04_07420 [Psychrilyobacter sp.]|nr:hypothetical protein [Psychrilyobacter sp.]
MDTNPKEILITDGNGNIKSRQEYKYNKYGDPLLFIKKDKEDKIVTHWVYIYEYDDQGRKTMMEISDLGVGRKTKMEYKY